MITVLNIFLTLKMTEDGDFQQVEFMDLMKMAEDNETVLAMCDEVSKKCANTKDPNNDK